MELNELITNYKDMGLDILKELIAFPTVLDDYNPNCPYPFGIANMACLDYILNKGKALGFEPKNIDNYAGHLEFGDGDEVLGILAHLDVVPVVFEEWESNPFIMEIRDKKMYGRGTMDDKGPLVAALIAMKALKDEGFKPSKKIRLIMGCDEESGSRCLERYLEKEKTPDIAFSPDACFPLIYGEKAIISYDITGPADNVITYMNAGERYNIVPSKATMRLNKDLKKEYLAYLKENNQKGEIQGDDYIAYGVSVHGMCPEEGVNAIFVLFDFLAKNTDSKLAEFVSKYYLFDTEGKRAGYYLEDPELLKLTSNFAVVRCDEASIKLGFNIRAPKDEAYDLIAKSVTNITKPYGYSYVDLGWSKRHYVSPESDLVKTLLGAYRDVTGDMSAPITIGGGTYAREMSNAVAFGPCMLDKEDTCHISNEYMEVVDFENAIKIYYKAIKELAK